VKVLIVINGMGTGGAERSLFEMLPFFRRAGIGSTIACLNRRSEGVEVPTRDRGFDVRFITGGDWAQRALRLRRLIRDARPNLIHTAIFEADVAARLGAVWSDVPVLTSLVNTTYEPVRLTDPAIHEHKLRAAKAVDGWTARHLTTHFHAITNAVKQAAVRDLRIDPDAVTVIERGRDPDRLGRPSADRRRRARTALGLEEGAPVIATVGRQEFQKGQWHLLASMPRVLQAHPGTRVLLAGRSGNASVRLDEVMRTAGLDGHARLLGHRDDVPEILASSDLFVFPSLYEGLGGALIEAMALGLPIVASDLPAIREVVEPGRNAILVPPGSPADLAAAIGTLIDDEPRRRAMGERGRRIFEERFTLERSATRMIELVERVAAGGRHPRR